MYVHHELSSIMQPEIRLVGFKRVHLEPGASTIVGFDVGPEQLSILNAEMMLRGEDGTDLEIHQYVTPAGQPHPPMNHNKIASMHFMLRVTGIENIVAKVEELGYRTMTPIVESKSLQGFKYAYFRGPDQMMIELQEGSYYPQ